MTTAAVPTALALTGRPIRIWFAFATSFIRSPASFIPTPSCVCSSTAVPPHEGTQDQSLREYFEYLTIKPTRQAELVALLNEITIGETCFFRSQPQLDALRKIVIPKVLEAKAKLPLRRLRIWSAGCSTGEEPYTLSMLLLEEAQSRLKEWTIEILATDLNERSLAHAKNAIYGAYSTRNLTPYYRQKYFTPAANSCRCKPSSATASLSAG